MSKPTDISTPTAAAEITGKITTATPSDATSSGTKEAESNPAEEVTDTGFMICSSLITTSF